MRGSDLKIWRIAKGWTQSDLMHELEIKSRQTIVKWEASDHIPRILELAVRAIDELPDCRKDNVAGTRLDAEQETRHRKIGIEISETEKQSPAIPRI